MGYISSYGTWLIDLFLDSLEQPLAAVLPLAPLLILLTKIPSSMNKEPLQQHLSSLEICAHTEAWIPLHLKQAILGSDTKWKDKKTIYKLGCC